MCAERQRPGGPLSENGTMHKLQNGGTANIPQRAKLSCLDSNMRQGSRKVYSEAPVTQNFY